MNLPQDSTEWLDLFETFYQSYAGWIVASSILTIILSMALIPFLIARIPEDYFSRPEHPIRHWKEFTVLHLTLLVFRNMLGLVFLFAGFLMLFLPGQGILTLVAGLALMVFPGKRKLEIWLIKKKGVFNALNWVREKFNKAPLIRPDGLGKNSA